MSNTTGITKHDFNSLYRVVKHTVKRYPQIKAKVKDATNTDPWGPSTEDKSVLAEACFHSDDREIIMRALFGRMRKSEKLIQVAKALDCLYYIALHGPDEVILDLRNDAELVYNVLRTAPSSESALIRRAEKVRELIQEPAVVVAERERARRLCEKMSTTMFSTVDRGGSSDSYNDTAPNGGTLEGSPSLSVCVGGGLLPSGPSSPNHANSPPKAGNSGTDPETPKLKKLPSSGNLSLPPSGSLSRNQLPGSSPRGPVNNASAPWAPQPRPADTLDGIFSSSNTLGIFPTGASVSVGAPQAFQPGPPSSASWSTNGVSNPNNGTNVPFQPQEDWFPFGNDSTNAQPAVPETCFMTGGKSSELSWDFTKPQTNTATSQPTPVNSVKSSHHPKDPSAALDELFGVKAPSKDIRSLNELRASPQM